MSLINANLFILKFKTIAELKYQEGKIVLS